MDSSDGSTLYVAATGTPYPIAATESGNSKGAITFDHWNDPVSVDAPKGAVDIEQARRLDLRRDDARDADRVGGA